ncbi:MAG: 50S ribosomal protein L33 [Patescibacteria group bacterium]
MAQDNLVKLECTVCKRIDNYTKRNKKLKVRLELSKFCKKCKKHVAHKETK